MKFTQEHAGALNVVQACSPGRIRIREQVITDNVLLTPERVVMAWTTKSPDALAETDFEAVFATDPEVIILGTGAALVFPNPKLNAAVLGRGIGFEVMDTAAACRTYNVLALEGRRVSAALLL